MGRKPLFKATKLIFQCTPDLPDNETIQAALDCTIPANNIEVRGTDYLKVQDDIVKDAQSRAWWQRYFKDNPIDREGHE